MHFFSFLLFFVKCTSAQKLLLLFLDGFRWDYIINRSDLKGFNQMRKEGGYIKKVLPVFPADCHPNIYSIFTGLYPRHHGVISNQVYSPSQNIMFDHENPVHRRNIHEWVNAEPLWATIKKQNKISLVYHLPICEDSFGLLSPSYCVPYSKQYMEMDNFNKSVSEALKMLKHGSADLAVVYNDAMDRLTHNYGPGSGRMAYDLLPFVDAIIQRLLKLTWHTDVHLMLVSDHGMATIARDRQIFLERILLRSQTTRIINQGGYAAIWPHADYFKNVLFRVSMASRDGHFRAYTGDSLPRHWNVHDHPLTPPLLMVAEPGFFITSMELPFPEWEDSYDSGWHGYSPDHADMSSLLLVHGPLIRRGAQLEEAHVTDSYPLLALLAGNVEPRPHNGSASKVMSLLLGFSGDDLSIKAPRSSGVTSVINCWLLLVAEALILLVAG